MPAAPARRRVLLACSRCKISFAGSDLSYALSIYVVLPVCRHSALELRFELPKLIRQLKCLPRVDMRRSFSQPHESSLLLSIIYCQQQCVCIEIVSRPCRWSPVDDSLAQVVLSSVSRRLAPNELCFLRNPFPCAFFIQVSSRESFEDFQL